MVEGILPTYSLFVVTPDMGVAQTEKVQQMDLEVQAAQASGVNFLCIINISQKHIFFFLVDRCLKLLSKIIAHCSKIDLLYSFFCFLFSSNCK